MKDIENMKADIEALKEKSDVIMNGLKLIRDYLEAKAEEKKKAEAKAVKPS
jgi:hypothetical protein